MGFRRSRIGGERGAQIADREPDADVGRLAGVVHRGDQRLACLRPPAYSTETNYLRVYTAQLRRKLERDPSHPRHILTHPGAGYRFEVEAAQ